MPSSPRLVSLAVAILVSALSSGAGAADFSPAAVPAQEASPANGGSATFHLQGTVVDGVTGKPVSRALVISGDRRLATMTNDEGAFSLTITGAHVGQGSLPFGGPGIGFRLYLSAQKPGYLPPSDTGSVEIGGASTVAVQLKLMPAAVIAGHVYADRSVVPRNVRISLLAHNVVDGERRWMAVNGQNTERDGSFRFVDLSPGEYTVMTGEWRGDLPPPRPGDGPRQEYPPVFFGDTPSLTAATKLHVHYGEAAQTDLHLRSATYFPVKVPVNGPANAGVNVRVNSADALDGFQLGYNGSDHAVEGALPSGTYTLNLSSFRPQRAYATTVLHVADRPAQTAAVTLNAPAPITVRLHRDFTGTTQAGVDQSHVSFSLLPDDRFFSPFVTGNTQQGQTDEIILPAVAPGRYTVRVDAGYGYAASVQYAGADLQAQPLVLGEGGAIGPIDVTLRDDTGALEGTVTTDGAPQPSQTFVCLLPASPGAQFAFSSANTDGKFTLGNVVPGSYRLFATSKAPWLLPVHDVETLQAFDHKGTAVTLSPRARLQMDAPLLDERALELP